MEYRLNQRTGDSIGVIGMGTSSINVADPEEGIKTLRMALENGINYYDLAAAESAALPMFGEAFGKERGKVIYQAHFGADYGDGKSYARAAGFDAIKKSIQWQLEQLKTDYIDYGYIHCMDNDTELDAFLNQGVLEWMKELKKQNVVRHFGMSTHTPAMARKILATGIVDMLMFSINPAYDYGHGDYSRGGTDERMELYRQCAALGVGISVMKPFSGGQLLDARTSPFGKSLTTAQCIQYALDKPGVLTVLPGIRDRKDLKDILGYFTTDRKERDYSVISGLTPRDMEGVCVYCNHCQPCPAGLDIGLINKYYDLAKIGDGLARKHYEALPTRADSCLQCGHCNEVCPFHVDQMARMREIAASMK